MTNTSIKLTEAFLKGLETHNLSYEMILANNWRYCGGDNGSHFRYFKLCFPNRILPEKVKNCVCSHAIKENCFITDGDRILILGNCCIKKFIPKKGRTCEVCGDTHKNTKTNRCKICNLKRLKKCNKCGNFHTNKYFDKCDTCLVGFCNICDKTIKPCFKKCFKCNLETKKILFFC